jgi:hypothetical protein
LPTVGASQAGRGRRISPGGLSEMATSAVSGARHACPLAAQIDQTGRREMSIIDAEWLWR